MTRKYYIDSFGPTQFKILTESEARQYTNESAFQQRYANITNTDLPSQVLCVVEGRFGKNNAISVNDRYYPDNFWDEQLAKEQTQFLLKKGLMYCLFGHVDSSLSDKDVEDGIVAAIVTHLEVVHQPTTINGKDYIDFALIEDPKYVAKCAEDIYLLTNYLNGIDSIIIDIDKFCSEITQIINASIDHGGDHGGPYCIDSDDFRDHLNQFIKNLGLDDKVKILYDSYGHFMSIMPKNRRE